MMNTLKTKYYLILWVLLLSSHLSASPDEYECPHPEQMKWEALNSAKTRWDITARYSKGWRGSYTTTTSNHPENKNVTFDKTNVDPGDKVTQRKLTCTYSIPGGRNLELRQSVKATQCEKQDGHFECYLYQAPTK